MARKPNTPVESYRAADRRRQKYREQRFAQMNRVAALGILSKAAVLQVGVVRNAVGGILPVAIANDRHQRRGRR